MPAVNIKGGAAAKAAIRKALSASGVTSLQVGFFKNARYPNGTPVAAVAAWNEFGTVAIPERPFFRNALRRSLDPVRELVAERVDPRKMEVDPLLADEVGAYVAGQVQSEIVRLREPSNASSTIARKGSSNPLIDKGKMRQSVTWRTRRSRQ